MKYKIYFVEKTIPFNASDFDKTIISGSEKTLINISNELAKNDKFDIKVFNLTNNNQKICNVEWKNINQIYNDNSPDILISMSDAKLLSLFNTTLPPSTILSIISDLAFAISFKVLKFLLGMKQEIQLLKLIQNLILKQEV